MGTLRRWWWIPLVAVLGIFLKALLLVPWVTGIVETASTDALAANNLAAVDFVEVDGVDGLGGDGLNVVLQGPAADETAAVAAVAARDEVNKVTYLPTDDSTDDEASAVVDDEPAVVAEPDPAPVDDEPAAPVLRPAALGMAATGGAIVLTGDVADEATRDGIVAAAEAEYGPANVTDELTIGSGVASEGGELVVTGEAESNAEQAQWLAAAGAVAAPAGLDVVDRTTVRAVEDQLNALFELEPIEFDVNRSTIRTGSIATLDAAAQAINSNPDAGRFQVVGHTDGDGSASSNQALSEARAEAVVAYLVESGEVDPDRLEAIGVGEDEPLVDPEVTREDKQRNRRIEWRRLP